MCKSTLHRVVTDGTKERYSTAFFMEPNFNAVSARCGGWVALWDVRCGQGLSTGSRYCRAEGALLQRPELEWFRLCHLACLPCQLVGPL